MTFFLWAVLALTCAALMWALAAFDRLIDIGSEAAGDRRTGGRKVNSGVIPGAKGSSFRNGLDRNRLFVEWLFRAPEWASEFPIARILFRRFRIGSAIAFIGFVSFGAGVFLDI
jgi:hypothetical protein